MNRLHTTSIIAVPMFLMAWTAGLVRLDAAQNPAHPRKIIAEADACRSPYYWEHNDYEVGADGVADTELSARQILRMGVDRFVDYYVRLYTRREGRAPTSARGSEHAELVYLWVKRQDNLRRLRRLPARDALLIRRLDRALTQIDYCHMTMQESEMLGGTGWLADMRYTALRHEDLLARLIASHPHWRQGDRGARARYEKVVHLLAATAEQEATLPQNALDADGYRKALSGFRRRLTALRTLTERPLPAPALDALADCLRETQRAVDRHGYFDRR